jgi:predicted PurR-regulated permease PerM
MSPERRLVLWLLVFVGAGLLIYLLRAALFPFVAGMVVAYLLDPLADKLEARRCPRGVAAALIVGAFLAALVTLIIILVPVLSTQTTELIARIPDYLERFREFAQPLIVQLRASLSDAQVERLREAANDVSGSAVGWLGAILRQLASGGAALLGIVSLAVIMPVVAFYLLRDWDRIVDFINRLLPRESAETIRVQVREIDARLSGFLRGQALVCLILGTFYAVGLSLVGLDFALLVGMGAGLISFIPYFGTAVGLISGLGLALAQFSEWLPIILVGAVFGAGQMLEGLFLTPKLVGDRVGLHPIWVLFALMAAGSLFGFTGILLAVPAAAMIGVVVRFIIDRYLGSALYQSAGGPKAGVDGGSESDK